MERLKSITNKSSLIFLAVAFIVSITLKIINIDVGSPFVTIDDNTTFEGGFLVWFGNVPPQRMYVESWISGFVCIATYIAKNLFNGVGLSVFNVNLVADAFRDYYGAPDIYVLVYRCLMLLIDMATAWFVYLLGVQVLKDRWKGFAAALVSVLYLFSYNTVWCNLVARPDTLVSFFGVTGLYMYYRSDFGDEIRSFWVCSALFGCAAGMKLHGAFFAIFILFDLLRVHGLVPGLRKAVPLVLISILFFALSAGIPLFDPLKYVKLRMLNYKDDLSPWITWSDHFITLFKGTGWLTIPLILVAAWKTNNGTNSSRRDKIKSIVLLSICWLSLFCAIRALRAYWMLPVLPLFYIAAVYTSTTIKYRQIAIAVAGAILLTMFSQTFYQFQQFRSVEYNELRRWVMDNVQKNDPIYIFGYEALSLPKSTHCIHNIAAGLERNKKEDLNKGMPFTLRHLKNWEENRTLTLFDMLNFKYDGGYTYYGYYTAPLELFNGFINLKQIQYVFVQQYFMADDEPGLSDYLRNNFNLIAHVVGAGGGGRGLSYDIYKRISEQ